MKKYLIVLLILLAATILLAKSGNNNFEGINRAVVSNRGLEEPDSKLQNGDPDFSLNMMTINQNDTVVFNMAQSVINGNHITFPVSILSDDTIFSLDFSFKYDQVNFMHDTMINLTNYLQPLSWYNATDSTWRFTSYSSQRVSNDTPLVSVRFTMFSVPICTSDLSAIHVYLNGDLCSVKIIDCITTGISDLPKNDFVNIYPNPAREILNVEVLEKATIQLLDINGKEVMERINVSANQKQEINTQKIDDGIYILKVQADNFVSMKKVVVNKK